MTSFPLQKRTAITTLLLILLVGGVLRWHNLDTFGLGGDEKYSLLVSQFISQEGGGQNDVLRNPETPYFTNYDLHRPKNFTDFQWAIAHRDNGSGATYDLLLHYWSKVFGVGDAALRSFSLLINLLTVLLLYLFTERFTQNRKLALLAAFITAVSPFYVVYSQVARNYALLFCFALLLTYGLLAYLESRRKRWLVIYSVTAFLALQTHYSVFTLFIIHGIYVLLYYRRLNVILPLLSTAILPIVGMYAWLHSTGGKWAFHSIAVSAQAYLEMATANPTEWLQLSTPKTVFSQLVKVITYTVPVLHNFSDTLIGTKNILISVFMGVAVFIILRLPHLKPALKIGAGVFLLVFSGWFYSVNPLNFVGFSLLIGLVLYLLPQLPKPLPKIFVLSVLIIGLSWVFLAAFAFKDGTTMRIIPRYAGYAYAFAGLLTAAGFYRLLRGDATVKAFTGLFILYLGFAYFGIFSDIYRDRSPNYFHQFPEPRIKNPYQETARVVTEKFMPGDTLLLPSERIDTTFTGYAVPKYSVQDAQYFNIYLLPAGKEIIQRIDKSEPDKIVLKSADGKTTTLFDFEGSRYRY